MIHLSFTERLRLLFGGNQTLEVACTWCAKRFTVQIPPGNTPRPYCCDSHAKKARRFRDNREGVLANDARVKREVREFVEKRMNPVSRSNVSRGVPARPGACPTPDKKQYTRLEDAYKHIAEVDTLMKPYVCPGCGLIHVGHSKF